MNRKLFCLLSLIIVLSLFTGSGSVLAQGSHLPKLVVPPGKVAPPRSSGYIEPGAQLAGPLIPLTPQESGWVIQDSNIGGDRISMGSPNDGWIVDFLYDTAYLYRWNGTSWSSQGSKTHSQYIVRGDVQMISATDGWLVMGGPLGDQDAQSSIYRWNGSSWAFFTTISDPYGVSFSAVDMISATDGWAAAGFDFGSYLYRWNGSSWQQHTPIYLPAWIDNDIDMLSSTNGWAVGRDLSGWNGSTWTTITSPITSTLNSVSMISSTDGWSVGGEGGGPCAILHWNGISWTEVDCPVSTRLNSISMVSTSNGWAVGDDGVIIHWDGNAWTQATSPTTANLNSITMLSPNDGWIAGDGLTLRYGVDPTLLINYPNGSPGSYFTISGAGFPSNDTASITVNGHPLGTIPTNGSGEFIFVLSTTNAGEGAYYVTVSVNPTVTVRFALSSEYPLRPQADAGTVFEIPVGIALTEEFYLPLIQR